MKIFLHLKDYKGQSWYNCDFDFKHIPRLNELFSLEIDGDVFRVLAVLHTPTSEKSKLEIYAEQFDLTSFISSL